MTNQATHEAALVKLAAEGIAAFRAQFEDYKRLQAEQQAREARDDDTLGEKLGDAMTPGFQAEFDPDEAQHAGAFVEDAISEVAALDSVSD